MRMRQHHGPQANSCKGHRSHIIQKLPGFLTVKLNAVSQNVCSRVPLGCILNISGGAGNMTRLLRFAFHGIEEGGRIYYRLRARARRLMV